MSRDASASRAPSLIVVVAADGYTTVVVYAQSYLFGNKISIVKKKEENVPEARDASAFRVSAHVSLLLLFLLKPQAAS